MDKLICIGKNYLEHALELGDAVPESPVYFFKPPSVLKRISDGQDLTGIKLPPGRGVIHPEIEIVFRIGKNSKPDAVTLGLDMTLRDIQSDLKKKGLPWEISKIFPDAAVVGPWISLESFPEFLDTEFTLSINGTVRQKAQGKQMRFSYSQCLSQGAKLFPICEGDLLFTGTPPGVTGVHEGDRAELKWGDRLKYSVRFQ